MPTNISFDSNKAWTSQDIRLGGEEFRIVTYLNQRLNPSRFYIDLYQGDTPLKLGSKLTAGSDPFGWYLIDEFQSGMILLVRMNPNLEVTPTKGNIGFNKDFRLVYYTYEELAELL
jgi:hypothetical protein